MTRREKRLQRIRQNPKAVTFEQLRRVLEDYEFVLRPGRGSHRVFRAEIEDRVWTLTIAHRRPHILAPYVRRTLRLIDEVINWLDELESENGDE